MSEPIKSKPYFSAYALKSMNTPATEGTKPRNNQFLRVINRLRVFPMDIPYAKRTSINNINIPVTIQPADKNWFTNYE